MTADPPSVRILVCGSADRGDDGAALSAIAHVLPHLDSAVCRRLEVRRCPQLDASDLVDVLPDEACLVLDTVVGVAPGSVVDLPIDALAAGDGILPRSSHALPIQQVISIAESVRGSLPRGRFVGIGGKWFGFGPTRSRALRDAMPEFEQAISAAIVELAQPGPVRVRT